MPFLQVNYKRIYYRDTPPANGAPPRETLVLLHGLGSSHNYYTGVIPYLTAQSFRCISIDAHGSGLSSYSHVEQTVDSLAVDVVDIMDALSISQAVVIGHSMSGMTAPHLSVNWPDRISALILIGPVFPTEAVASVFEERIAKIRKDGLDSMADTVPWSAVGSKAQSIHNAMIRTLILGSSPQGYISNCKVIANAYKSPPEYHKVACPTLIIAGDEDKSAPLPGCEQILQSLGSEEKELKVLKGVGHWHCVEVPAEVGKEIVDFMKQIQ